MVVYKAGDMICSSSPYVHIIKNIERGKRCSYCLSSSNSVMMPCPRCFEQFYCSHACCEEDWRQGHQFKECQLYQLRPPSKFKDDSTEVMLLLTRLVLKTKLDESALLKVDAFDGRTIGINDLRDSFKTFEVDSTCRTITELVAENLNKIGVYVSVKELIKYYGKLMLHATPISDGFPVPTPIGRGLYLTHAALSHSCHPNAVNSYQLQSVIRATRTIDTQFDEPAINLVHLFKPRDERLVLLKQLYHINCECSRCRQNDYFSYRIHADRVNQLRHHGDKSNLKGLLATEIKLIEMEKLILGEYHSITTSRLFNCMTYSFVLKSPKYESFVELFNKAAFVTHGYVTRV